VAEVRVSATIDGTTPLLCNRFGDAAAMGAGEKVRISGPGDKGTPREQAESKLYVNNSGKLIIPQPNIFRCLIDAGKFFKVGKNKVTTQNTSLIPACVEVPGVEFPLIHREPWAVDTRAVRNPSTGGRLLCHRPSFNDWRLEFEAKVDTDFMPIKLFRDFRPDKKGPFGKFVVVSWVVDDPARGNGRSKKTAVGIA
jgi:hypothetical protein